MPQKKRQANPISSEENFWTLFLPLFFFLLSFFFAVVGIGDLSGKGDIKEDIHIDDGGLIS